MILKKIASSLLLALAVTFSSTANATFETSTSVPSLFAEYHTRGPFSDVHEFTTASRAALGFDIINFPVFGLLNAVLTSGTLFSNPDGVLFNDDDSIIASSVSNKNRISFSTSAVPIGNYYLSVTGISNGSVGGAYAGAMQMTSVSAVPEPHTVLMLVVGLALIGGIARRKMVG